MEEKHVLHESMRVIQSFLKAETLVEIKTWSESAPPLNY